MGNCICKGGSWKSPGWLNIWLAILVWSSPCLYLYCEFFVDAKSWEIRLFPPPHLWPKSKDHSISSNKANIYVKFRSNNFTGLMPLWSLLLCLLSPLASPKQLTVRALQLQLLLSPLCNMECLSPHPDPITVCVQPNPGLCFLSWTDNSSHILLFIANCRISWRQEEWGEGSYYVQRTINQFNKFLSFADWSFATVPWLVSWEENWPILEGIWTFDAKLLDNPDIFFFGTCRDGRSSPRQPRKISSLSPFFSAALPTKCLPLSSSFEFLYSPQGNHHLP